MCESYVLSIMANANQLKAVRRIRSSSWNTEHMSWCSLVLRPGPSNTPWLAESRAWTHRDNPVKHRLNGHRINHT